MSEARIQIAYDGKALARGEMDVRQLAPALLAIGDLLESVNKALNNDAASVNVRVKSDFKQGSFEIDFIVIQSWAEQVKMLVTGAGRAISASYIAGLIGFTASASGLIGVNLIDAIRWLKGRKIEQVDKGKGDTVVIKAGPGSTIVVNKYVNQLVQDRDVRQNLDATLKPLESPGIDTFDVRQNGETIQRITKNEMDIFRTPPEEEERLVQMKQTMVLELVSPVFKDDRKWEFTDGDAKITATIEDGLFLADVEEGRTAFAKGDQLFVDLVKTQSRKGKRLVTENIIVRVREHVKRGKQLRLDFGSNDDG